ncbi:hypothetical protein CEXT_95851 [Caerostris extrusa]|uniref:Uncharacterized protein n=1 Tax=Caerostris extrusa TaxID=172846 RepID=A0AAV4R988_CAEEX|nr:hypothetical protein CEXT_95851 [Caerostris extrusa]
MNKETCILLANHVPHYVVSSSLLSSTKWMFKGRDKIRRYSIKIRSFSSRTIGDAAYHHRNCVLQDTMVVVGYKNVQHAAVRMERKKNGMMGVERTS